MLAFMAFQSEPDSETLKKLAEVAGWTIPEARMQEIAALYKPIFDDTRVLRKLNLGDSVPATVFEAE